MNRFFVLMAGVLLTWTASGIPIAAADAKLSLLLITADDMNYDSPGWMGNRLKATPNLDTLATSGCRFVNQHVTVPICQPCRSALMTGRVPHRNGALGFNPINTDVPTLVEVLRDAGYFTAVLNKGQHMAPATKFPWDVRHDGSGKNPQLFRQQIDASFRAAAAAKKPFFINANITDPHRPFYGSNQGEQKQAKTAKKAQKAAQKEADGVVTPFTPAEVTVPAFLEDIPLVRQEVAQYYSSVRRLDKTLGEILASLKATGQEDKTIVVFLSDHGMSFPFSKASVYYNGSRSPVILRYPGMGQPRALEEFVSSVDLMPTLLDLLGIVHPAGMDGRSWLPLLKGESQPDRDYVVTHVNTVSSGKSFPQRCVRTKERSLMFHAWADGQTDFRVEAMSGLSYNALAAAAENDPRIRARVDQYIKGTPLALFDLDKDPTERRNVIDDPSYATDRQRLTKLLLAHMEKTDDPQLENYKKAVATTK